MRYSLRAHVHETTPDVLYGDVGQLWVDGGNDFGVRLLEVGTSEPPGQRFGGHLLLLLMDWASREVVGLSRCDLEHFWRDRGVWIENKVRREGDWRTPRAERLEIINTGMPTKGSHEERDRVFPFLGKRLNLPNAESARVGR